MLYIIFGYPGAGKTYTGKLFQKHFGFYFYDGDASLPEDMKQAINTQQLVTDAMRDEFFNTLLKDIGQLYKKYPNLVVAQTYIKEKYRKDVLAAFPDAKFVLIQTDTNIREKRLLTQHAYNLTLPYVRQMIKKFEKPSILYEKILNNVTGDKSVRKQIQLLENN